MGLRKQVLVAELDPATDEYLGPTLARTEFEVSRAVSVREAKSRLGATPFDVAILGLPDPIEPLRELLKALQPNVASAPRANVLLVSPAARLAEAEAFLAQGVHQVLAAGGEGVALQQTVLHFLQARPRVDSRVMARLTVRLGESSPRLMCQTRNLSRSGMLAVTDHRFPLAAPVQFHLELAETGQTVGGEAEVARLARPPRDPVEGLGLRFKRFDGDGENRLVAFLQKHGG